MGILHNRVSRYNSSLDMSSSQMLHSNARKASILVGFPPVYHAKFKKKEERRKKKEERSSWIFTQFSDGENIGRVTYLLKPVMLTKPGSYMGDR